MRLIALNLPLTSEQFGERRPLLTSERQIAHHRPRIRLIRAHVPGGVSWYSTKIRMPRAPSPNSKVNGLLTNLLTSEQRDFFRLLTCRLRFVQTSRRGRGPRGLTLIPGGH